MTSIKQFLLGIGALTLAGLVQASPVTFNVGMVAIAPSSGYGIDANETSGTKLDVRFTALTSPYVFNLNNVGDQYFFKVGTVAFREPLANGGINAAEAAGNLDVSAQFLFTSPFSGPQLLTATGKAFTGIVNDPAVDYRLNWDADTVYFAGGSFDFALVNMSFTQNTDPVQDLIAVITLRALPAQQVPEPASLALLGASIAGLGLMRRRRTA